MKEKCYDIEHRPLKKKVFSSQVVTRNSKIRAIKKCKSVLFCKYISILTWVSVKLHEDRVDSGPEADLAKTVDGGQLHLQRVVDSLEAERESAVDLVMARQRDLRHQGPAPARARPPPLEDDVLHDGVQRHCAPGQHVLRHAALRQHHLLHL